MGGRVLILAHRGELLEQAADKLFKTTGLMCALEKAESGEPSFSLSSEGRASFAAALRTTAEEMRDEGFAPTILVDSEIRYALHCFAQSSGIDLTVFAFDELDASTRARQERVVNWQGA